MTTSTVFTRIVFGIIFFSVLGTASALTFDQGEPNKGSQLLAKQQPSADRLNNAWVEPYLEPVQIKTNSTVKDNLKVMEVWIMADDHQGVKIYYNQVSKKFGLAHYQPGKPSFTYAKYQELRNPGDVFNSQD